MYMKFKITNGQPLGSSTYEVVDVRLEGDGEMVEKIKQLIVDNKGELSSNAQIE